MPGSFCQGFRLIYIIVSAPLSIRLQTLIFQVEIVNRIYDSDAGADGKSVAAKVLINQAFGQCRICSIRQLLALHQQCPSLHQNTARSL